MEEVVTAAKLRDLIADALYSISAHHLPAVCTDLGLTSGTVEEAFSSKRQYVRGRLQAWSVEALTVLGRRVLTAHPNHALQEAINRLGDSRLRSISTLTRRHIFKALNNFTLGGDEDLLIFLRRFWPIDTLAWQLSDNSMSYPFVPFIVQHAMANDDVNNEEILEKLGARTCSQALLFQVIEATVHPERRDVEGQEQLVSALNPILNRDGFSLVAGQPVAGYATYLVREMATGTPADSAISEILSAFDEEGVHAAWRKCLERRSTDPEGAITSARTLLETVCKHIIEANQLTVDEKEELPSLYRKAASLLNLAPDQHTEETFKSILGSCQNVVNSLGTLRNRLSDAHGRGRLPVRPSARHAELAVNLAGTMATFLISTLHTRSKSAGDLN
jgi:hypothetical protein